MVDGQELLRANVVFEFFALRCGPFSNLNKFSSGSCGFVAAGQTTSGNEFWV